MWRSKLKEMKLHKWKVGLRKKMPDIKDIRDDRILKGAWTVSLGIISKGVTFSNFP